jgi:hypothetical protein
MDKLGAVTEKAIQKITQHTSPNLPKRLTANAASGPPEVDPLCDVYLQRLVCWRPDKGPIEIVRPLDAEERSCLTAHEAELEYCLTPYGEAERDEIKFAIVALFSGFRYLLRQEGISVETSIETLMVHLRDMPAWAIKRGCGLIINKNLAFAPNDGQIITTVLDIVRVYQDRLRRVQDLLTAEVADRTPLVQAPRKNVDRIGDGKHTQRVLAELEARKSQQQEDHDAQRVESEKEMDA